MGTRAFKMAHFRNECIICRSLHKFVIKFMIIYILEVITERQDPLLERDSCGHSKYFLKKNLLVFRNYETSAEILHCWWRICKKRSANWMKKLKTFEFNGENFSNQLIMNRRRHNLSFLNHNRISLPFKCTASEIIIISHEFSISKRTFAH